MNTYICINDVFSSRQKEIFKSLPQKNKEYTLKDIVYSSIDNKEGYTFEELPNPKHENGQEFSFRPSRFVPVDKLSVDTLVKDEEFSK